MWPDRTRIGPAELADAVNALLAQGRASVVELRAVQNAYERGLDVTESLRLCDEDTRALIEFAAMLNRSSWGTSVARALRVQADHDVVADIVARSGEPVKTRVANPTQATSRSNAVLVSGGRPAHGSRLMLGDTTRTTAAGLLPAIMVLHPREELFSVLVVDDHPLLREAISARLTQMGAGTVHEAASVAEARARALATGPCDLAILDLGLPDGTGIDLVTELRAQGWPRIVVLASSDDPYAVRSAFQAGAQAYLLKSASPMVVTDGVRRVLDGGVYADPSVAPVLAAGTRVPGTDNTPRELSAREVEVLQLVADGQSNKEIGEALSLSALTVKSHLSRIGRKLGTGDRAQMVALAMRAGMIR